MLLNIHVIFVVLTSYVVKHTCNFCCFPCTEKPTPVETTSKTTGAPTPITTDSPPQRCVVSKWSPWINRDKPDVGGSDHEQMTPEEKKRFCYGGNVTKIECAVNSENHIPYYSSGELVRYCDKEKGIMCSNADNYPVTCSDYKVRYYCECSNQTGKKVKILRLF